LYSIQLKAAQEWGSTSYVIFYSIHESINQELERKYETIEEKLKKKKTFTFLDKKTDYKGSFYPSVINKTNITVTNDESTLLNKDLKYNLDHKHENRIKTLALEAEKAITQLPIFEQDYIRYQVAHNIKQLYKQQEDQHTHKTIHMKKEEKEP
jgi:hypothetical protein